MNTAVEMIAVDWQQTALLQNAEQIFHDIEARFSRFRPESELSLLNARAGEACTVSPQLLQILEGAVYFHRLTGGIFDPAILPDLEAAGYDRSFEFVAASSTTAVARTERRPASITDLQIDRQRLTVTAPAHLRIDLGGIGKGYAVDAAAHVLMPARDFLINAGGDIFASGNSSEGAGWPVAVSDPFDEERDLDVVVLHDEAVATSTIARRRWERGGKWHTHLIDPRSGLSVENDVVSVTVIAPAAIEADVYAKTALLLGVTDGARFLEKRGVEGLFVLAGDVVHPSAGWRGAAAGITH